MGNVALSNKIEPTARKACVLAEELGHYHTTVVNILEQDDTNNRKQERTARKWWAYEKLVPTENMQFAFADFHTEICDMDEYLDLDEAFSREALIHYGILDL